MAPIILGVCGGLPSFGCPCPALVFLALCPALLAGTLSTWQAATAHRAMAQARLGEAGRVLALSLDRDVLGLATALESFALAAQLPDPAAARLHAPAAARLDA